MASTGDRFIRRSFVGEIELGLAPAHDLNRELHPNPGFVLLAITVASSYVPSSASHGRRRGRPDGPAPKHRAMSPAQGTAGLAASGRSLPSAALQHTPCDSAGHPAPATEAFAL